MSVVRSIIQWSRRTLTWSTSHESKQERWIAVGVLLSALLLAWWTLFSGTALWTRADGSPVRVPPAPVPLMFSLWGLWLLIVLVLMRLGQLKLLGPVLFYDMIRSARRSRYFLLRGFYSLVLLLVLFFVWMSVPAQNISARERSSRLAMDYFEIFSIVQLVAVALLTPAYMAGAISEEKDRKTLEFLLATDLRNREIVFSKFLSRFAHLLLFMLTGLPILSLLQFLGGIDPNLVFAGFVFTMLTVIGIGGMSILNSAIYKRPRDSIAISYLFMIAYVVITCLLFMYQAPAVFRGWPPPAPANGEEQFFEILYIGNPVVLLTSVYQSGVRGTLSGDLPGLMADYALFYGGVAVFSIAWSIARLRGIALRQTFSKVKLSQQAKERPPVGELPMLWKEIHVEGSLRLNWLAWILMLLLVLGTFANPFIWFVERTITGFGWNEQHNLAEEVNLWVRIAGTGVACMTILGVAIRAANSIGNERERQTMDGLLSTPLESTNILWAKFVGSLCSVRLGWVWLGSIYTVALVLGGLHLFALPIVLTTWFVFSSVAAMIGLGFSMGAHGTLRATVYTVLTCVILGVGHWLLWFCCGPILFFSGTSGDGAKYLVQFQMGVTPPVMLFFLSFFGDELAAGTGETFWREMIGFSVFGLFLWTLAALFYWNGILVPRFRKITGRDQGEEVEGKAGRAQPPPLPVQDPGDDTSAVSAV